MAGLMTEEEPDCEDSDIIEISAEDLGPQPSDAAPPSA